MAMSQTHDTQHHLPQRMRNRARRQRKPRGLLWLPVVVFIAGVVAAASWVTYILWPRWPAADMALDAPTLPITISGVNFNIPPAAIRNKVQRKPGTQERVDLVFLWPSLTPPDPAVKAQPVASAKAVDRIFMTITAYGNTRPPLERLNAIYPRYLETNQTVTESGLVLRPFRDGTPYQGEDILHDDAQPPRFITRCTRDDAKTIAMCLYERRIDQADMIVRFPREWLSDWKNVAEKLDGLMDRLRSLPRQ